METNTNQNRQAEELLTAEDIARLYKVSRRCVTNWIKARIIPCLRVGRVLRFHPERVREAMDRYEQREITR